MPVDGAAEANDMKRIESRDDFSTKPKGRKTKAATATGAATNSISSSGSSVASSSRPLTTPYKLPTGFPPLSASSSTASLAVNMATTQLVSPRSNVVHIPNQYVPGGRLPTQAPASRQSQGSAGVQQVPNASFQTKS